MRDETGQNVGAISIQDRLLGEHDGDVLSAAVEMADGLVGLEYETPRFAAERAALAFGLSDEDVDEIYERLL